MPRLVLSSLFARISLLGSFINDVVKNQWLFDAPSFPDLSVQQLKLGYACTSLGSPMFVWLHFWTTANLLNSDFYQKQDPEELFFGLRSSRVKNHQNLIRNSISWMSLKFQVLDNISIYFLKMGLIFVCSCASQSKSHQKLFEYITFKQKPELHLFNKIPCMMYALHFPVQ